LAFAAAGAEHAALRVVTPPPDDPFRGLDCLHCAVVPSLSAAFAGPVALAAERAVAVPSLSVALAAPVAMAGRVVPSCAVELPGAQALD
jgi:hypothetical protein